MCLLAVSLAFAVLACSPQAKPPRVVVLGMDGVDPLLLRKFMDEGKLPHFSELAKHGSFTSLGTSTPPQSPVAWSTFITGVDPSSHGIFDFIHRDPEKYAVVPSLTTVLDSETKLLRRGEPFWNLLEEHGVPCTLIKIPASYPPVHAKGTYLTGMGTPDLEGSYGTYSFYTDREDIEVKSGRLVPVAVREGRVKAAVVGPQGESLPFQVSVDIEQQAALLELGRRPVLLKSGEWSEWIPLEFPSAKGMVRVYLKSLLPHFELYLSPVNIDPEAPAVPISNPPGFAHELYDCCDRFYTQGMPEETKALGEGVLSDADFMSQNELVVEERLRLFRNRIEDLPPGFFFFYFSSTDIIPHLYWNAMDPTHPGYRPERAQKYGKAIEQHYQVADQMLGEAMQAISEEDVLIVVSDHGFAPFKRAFDLNRWLIQEGYQALKSEDSKGLSSIDWAHTRAYAVGFNGLYLNLRGREKNGRVESSEAAALKKELAEKLLDYTDPVSGNSVVHTVDAVVPKEGLESVAPDLIVGYERGYRASWQCALGEARKEVLRDNLEVWSGDHLMSAELVPGVLLANRPLRRTETSPHLRDLAPTIAALYHLRPSSQWRGKPLLLEQ